MPRCCDLLENIYLCGINNNELRIGTPFHHVVICLKISTFVVSTTTLFEQLRSFTGCDLLENIYLCGINNNACRASSTFCWVVICLKISTFVVSTTTKLMIAWLPTSCDLLENIYLCGINNNRKTTENFVRLVVICLKISTFVVSTTTVQRSSITAKPL